MTDDLRADEMRLAEAIGAAVDRMLAPLVSEIRDLRARVDEIERCAALPDNSDEED